MTNLIHNTFVDGTFTGGDGFLDINGTPDWAQFIQDEDEETWAAIERVWMK